MVVVSNGIMGQRGCQNLEESFWTELILGLLFKKIFF